MKSKKITTREKIHLFFEQPKSLPAYITQGIIVALIVVSVGTVVLEFFHEDIYKKFGDQIHILNFVILGIFTAEYVIRLLTSPKKFHFIRKPMNIIDLLAVAPNYVELLLPFFIETTELRVFRLLRLLRFSRALRAFKLFKYGKLLRKVFQFHETVLEAILPIMGIFIGIKGITWALEANRLWLSNANLGELFAIIGFALGIILSQKIGASYDKFISIEETVIRIYGNLRTLSIILQSKKSKHEAKIIKEWSRAFLLLLSSPGTSNFAIHSENAKLYAVVHKIEKTPSDLAILCGEIIKDSAFCLSKKERIVPKAYDTLLHQATMLYLLLITVFIPGLTGLISVFAAVYILYGMYQLTQDFDSILGGKHNLINIDLSELEYLANEEHVRRVAKKKKSKKSLKNSNAYSFV